MIRIIIATQILDLHYTKINKHMNTDPTKLNSDGFEHIIHFQPQTNWTECVMPNLTVHCFSDIRNWDVIT